MFNFYLLSGSNMHHSSSSSSMAAEQTTRGVAVEKLEYMKKWGFNTYKVNDFCHFRKM